MTSSFAYGLAKTTLSLVGALIGFIIANLLIRLEVLTDPINLFYLSLLGALLSYLMSTGLARRFETFWVKLKDLSGRIPPQAVLAAGIGATTALIITVLLNTLLENVPGFTWYWSLLLTLILVTASSWFFVVNRQLFFGITALVPSTAAKVEARVLTKIKLIDTSSIIDGRISEIALTHFMDGELQIPKFVLNELQGIADSGDPLTRTKGRKGLEVLDKLVNQQIIATKVINDDIPDVHEVDEKLIQLCQKLNADLITTDFNLNRVAALQNIKVLNVNQLANALKPVFLPGERLALLISKEGREQGQGLGYLEDGTMVVVEEGQKYVGSVIDVTVTSHLQTNMGRMIFARPHSNN